MKNILTIIASIMLFSCNSGNNGENIQQSEKITIENVAERGEELNDQMVQVTGMVSHVCKHGGQKMFLTNASQDANLLVRVSGSIPEFDVALEGSNVEVTGKLISTVVDESATEEHDAVNHEEGVKEAQPENCPTEDAMNEGSEPAKITYHIEATSYRELVSN